MLLSALHALLKYQHEPDWGKQKQQQKFIHLSLATLTPTHHGAPKSDMGRPLEILRFTRDKANTPHKALATAKTF